MRRVSERSENKAARERESKTTRRRVQERAHGWVPRVVVVDDKLEELEEKGKG